MIHKRIREIIGDPVEVKKELKGVNFRLTLEQAQLLVNLICKYKRWPIYKVKYTNRKCKRLYAYCDIEKKTITVHNIPETVQLILHEVTHIKIEEHDEKFKRMQLKLIKLYKERFLKILFGGNDVRN